MTEPVVKVRVARTKGSTPREAGAEMLVWQGGQSGSIGGGALEFEASRQARQMLDDGPQRMQMEQSLGPDLDQCCGGHVVLEFEQLAEGAHTAPHNKSSVSRPVSIPVWIYGAGHVGRALAQILAPIEGLKVTLIDTKTARMPANLPHGITAMTDAKMHSLVSQAPPDAHHFIMTMSHGFDLEVCDALLNHGFAFAGLIGSKTKWARFRARLADRGHTAAEIGRITSPVGDPTLGKEPQIIAVSIAHALLLERIGTESSADNYEGRGT